MSAKLDEPDLNDVALLVDVVRAESFSAVARQLGVPVSTVSRRIARLEESLGTRLLERTTRSMRLTDAGRGYFEHAERALDELGEGTRAVQALHAVPRGRVRITAPLALGSMLTAAMASYLEAAPNVRVEIDLSERRVDLLAEGVDIAVRAGAVDSGDLVAKKISESDKYLFASQCYLARNGRPKRLADLQRHSLISHRASSQGAVWELVEATSKKGRTRRHRFSFRPRLYVNELMAAASAVAAGAGIALLPAKEIPAGLVRVLPRFAGEPGGLWVMYPARRPLTAAVRSCVDHLIAELPRARTR